MKNFVLLLTLLTTPLFAASNTLCGLAQGGGTFSCKSGGTMDLQSGSTFNLGGTAVSATATELNLLSGLTSTATELNLIHGADRAVKVAKVALAAADTGGGILSWANPAGATIMITRLILNVTTPATSACSASFGVAANGTTSNAGLIDTLDIHTAAGVFDNLLNPGSGGKAEALMTSGQFLTGSKASGACAGTVGFAYVYYHAL